MNATRREFLKKTALTGALLASGPSAPFAFAAENSKSSIKTPRVDEYHPDNLKLSTRIKARTVTDEDLLILKQIGVRWARLEYDDKDVTLEEMSAMQQRFAKHGIKIYTAVHRSYKSLNIQLARADRDKDIKTYQDFLKNLGQLGIPVASYDFHPANTYTTSMVEIDGRKTRQFDVHDFRTRVEKQAFERTYSAEEIWANYEYFMKAVLPVAEAANVKLALHPDDPPLEVMNGVAKIFTHYEDYRRAEAIAGNSRHWGITFCIGTWGEGGDAMGKSIDAMIRDFGGRGKLFEIHFRNVSSTLPSFCETFPDEGYLDMYPIMKALREVKFSGISLPDHPLELAGDSGIYRASTAYCIAHMRTLLRRANEEVG